MEEDQYTLRLLDQIQKILGVIDILNTKVKEQETMMSMMRRHTDMEIELLRKRVRELESKENERHN